MLSETRTRAAALAALAILAASTAGGLAIGACGSSDDAARRAPAAARVSPTTTSPANSPVPQGVLDLESGAEDTIDLVLAGRQAKAAAAAETLDRVARGQGGADLAVAGVPEAKIALLQSRTARLTRLAPGANPLDTALAANRVFELVATFLGRYQGPVPAEVVKLDYLDFEAKLQALAGNRAAARAAVARLATTWKRLRPDVLAAGGATAAAAFDDHVAAMERLARHASGRRLASEAQHGLDLVDGIERVYTG